MCVQAGAVRMVESSVLTCVCEGRCVCVCVKGGGGAIL